jgi:hypothetical protein
MKVRIQVIVESDQGETHCIEDVAQFERGTLQPDTLGLTLAEAKALLQGVQRTIVAEQTTAYLEAHRPCPACQAPRRCKGHHQLVYRTVFGKLTLLSPRWYTCRCQTTEPRSVSPLAERLQERTAPELLYLEAKFAALMSYGVTVDVLGELLPIGAQLNATTVQRHLLRVAERMEQEVGEEQVMFVEGCPAEWEDLPAPDAPLTVGLDGGYVHARDERSRKAGWFEVIVGKSLSDEGASKCFGFVHTYDTKPKRRLFEVLKSQGMQANQQVTFLSDGGDTVRELQMYLHPEAEHLLDWFHINARDRHGADGERTRTTGGHRSRQRCGDATGTRQVVPVAWQCVPCPASAG